MQEHISAPSGEWDMETAITIQKLGNLALILLQLLSVYLETVEWEYGLNYDNPVGNIKVLMRIA